MERILQILAAALLIAAAYFLWRGVTDWSFVCGVLAASSFFLSIRFQIKGQMAERAAAEAEDAADGEPELTDPVSESTVDNMEKTPANPTLHS
jgi:hypothetical protein